MNLTLSIDAAIVAKARRVAQAQGTSVQELVRAYLRSLAGDDERDAAIERLADGWQTGPGESGGYVFRREDAYADRPILTTTPAPAADPARP